MSASLTERLKSAMPLNRAADLFARRPHVATMHRWCLRGCRGVKLRSWMQGGVRVTTPEAVEEFLVALNRDNSDDEPDEVARRGEEAGEALKKLGC